VSTLHVPDDVLKQIASTEREALIEIACRLYETRRLPFDQAARLAGVDLEGFADACASRRIPAYWYSADDLARDVETLKKMGI
jgi:predicted HTH domain antitoxin